MVLSNRSWKTIETNDLRKEKNCFQQLQFTFEGCALSNRVPLFVFKVGSESRLSDILSQMMSTRRSNTAWNRKHIHRLNEIIKYFEFHYGQFLLWDPTKKGQCVLHVYSMATFVASWLKWLLTPNMPLIQLRCARSKWNMDLKLVFLD